MFGAAASFFGGWCGTVPISVLIWYILHHHRPPTPDPDPWWKITFVGAFTGLVFGTLVNTIAQDAALLTNIVSGFVGGVVGASFVAKGTLSSIRK